MTPDSDADLTIPATLAADIQAAADEERRPAADVLRDAVIGYLENRNWRLREEDLPHARALGLAENAAPLNDEYHLAISEMIANGLASAREGRLVDGDAVFARIEAELDALAARQRK